MSPSILATVQQVLLLAVPIIIAITLHEAAHGYVARHFGDNTAADRGRVTLNPLKHIDPIGTIILPGLMLLTHTGFLFGYAKPVPVNGANLKNPRKDMIWVAAAGPGMNLLLAVISLLALLPVVHFVANPPDWLVNLLWGSVEINPVSCREISRGLTCGCRATAC
jgi:Zn-dependent protease